MWNKMRVMHGMTEIAGQNTYSVRGLKEAGIYAESVVCEPHPFHYPYDICLGIYKTKKIKYPWYVVKLGCFFLWAVRRYRVFHFHYGHSICQELDLWIYRVLKKKVFFEFHGSDLRDSEQFCKNSKIEFNPEYAMPDKIRRRNEKICKAVTGIILHDDELIPYLPGNHVPVYIVPLRMDVEAFVPQYPDAYNNSCIRIVHAPSWREGKGTQYVLAAFKRLKKKYSNIELVLVEGKTQQEAFAVYKTADIIVDQLVAGTYGVFAIESMALGKPVITYISDEMRGCLPQELPIQSADIDAVENVLEQLILDGNKRRQLGISGRQYVENYHDYRNIALILKKIYEGKIQPKTGRAAFYQVKKIKENRTEKKKTEQYEKVYADRDHI